jgi:hypothetical protein
VVFFGLALGVLAACASVRGAPARLAEGTNEESLEIRVWRAGRRIPPGISAARSVELEAERERAAERLTQELEAADAARIEAWLAAHDTDDELWCAAAATAAELGRYAWAVWLGEALDSAQPNRSTAARSALHALFGRWFQGRAELEPYLQAIEPSRGTRLFLGALEDEEQRSRERLFAELERHPPSAAGWLADPDPEVRCGAARILARVFAQEGQDQTGTLSVLVTHLESELDPEAFHGALEAVSVPFERLNVDDTLSARLRTLLIEIARSPRDPRALSVAQALARLPWRLNGARDLGHVQSGIEALGAMLRGLSEADRRRGVNDPDALVGVLAALRQLSGLASSGGLALELRGGPASQDLMEVLLDSAQDDSVRAAAAAALADQAPLDEGAHLAGVLVDPSVGIQVKHALLGALSQILPRLKPDAAGAAELVAAVAELSGDADADLRRRALTLLSEAELEAQVRALDPAFLVARLDTEEGREATLQVLALLQRFARAQQLSSLLATPSLARLARDPVQLDGYVALILRLALHQGDAALRAAQRLDELPSDSLGFHRLRQQLTLAASLDPAAAAALVGAEHARILGWVWLGLRAGLAPRELAPDGQEFEERLLELHLAHLDPILAAQRGLAAPALAHLSALLRADLCLAGSGAGRWTKPRVEESFESAMGLAESEAERLRIQRDRARFRAAANECVKALSDYRRLLEAGPEGEGLLSIPDLRSAVELLGRLDVARTGQHSATAGEAGELLARIVSREAWRSEPAAVRMQDLRDWVRRTLETRDAAAFQTLERALADLPLTQLEAQEERHEPPLWYGLTRDAAWFQELLDLRVRVRLGLRDLGGPGAAD